MSIAALAARLRQIAPLAEADLQALAALLKPTRFEPGAHLLEAGPRAHLAHFVVEGLVREYHLDDQGGEHTRAFSGAGSFTGSLLDLLSGESSVSWIEALEPTATLAFEYAAFEALCAERPLLALILRRLTEQLYVRKARREYELLALPAAERLARWEQQQPELVGRVSGRVLASYLGITPVHLSRLHRVRRESR